MYVFFPDSYWALFLISTQLAAIKRNLHQPIVCFLTDSIIYIVRHRPILYQFYLHSYLVLNDSTLIIRDNAFCKRMQVAIDR